MELYRKLPFRGMEDKRFFFHPKPFSGELLSSWLVRIALLHHFSPVTFMNIHFPQLKPDIWSRDIDLYWGTRQDLLEILSYKSRTPIQTLYQCTLNSYEGYLNEQIHSNARNKLITPVINRGRRNKGKALRFCPICLKNDSIPFFRKEWRLSFVTTCLKHKCFLQDCCPQCQSPISIYKLTKGDSLYHCYKCDASYLDCEVEAIPSDSYGMKAQKTFLDILYSGIFHFEGRRYYSLAYFDAMKQLSKLIYNFNLRKGINQRESYHKVHPLPIFDKKPSIYVESISLKEQYLVYSACENALKSFKRANAFCKKNKIRRTEMTHSMEYIPYWYDLIIRQNDYSQYSISLKEAKAALHYMEKNGFMISFRGLSKLTGTIIEKRKRADIAEYMNSLKK